MAISGFYLGLYFVFKGLSAAFSSPKKAEIGESRQGLRRAGGGRAHLRFLGSAE